MRFLASILLIVLFTFVPCTSQASREMDVARRLLAANSIAELSAALDEAKSAEIAPQVSVEAKMLFGIRTQDTAMLTSLLPELSGIATKFNPRNSIAGLGSVEQLRGMIAYVRALVSMEEGNEQEFRQHIADAFWNYPQQGELFGRAVEQFQLRDKMQRWAIDFTSPFLESGAKETTLGDVMGSQKVMVLIFWAGTTGASADTLPFAQHLADTVKRHSIGVACVNMDRNDGEATTEKMRAKLKPTIPWLLETNEHVISTQVEISSLPRAVVINQQGRVVFHGHPLEMTLWRVLKRYAPTLVVPTEK